MLCTRILSGLLILTDALGEAAVGMHPLGSWSFCRFFLSCDCGVVVFARKESKVPATSDPGLKCPAGWKKHRI